MSLPYGKKFRGQSVAGIWPDGQRAPSLNASCWQIRLLTCTTCSLTSSGQKNSDLLANFLLMLTSVSDRSTLRLGRHDALRRSSVSTPRYPVSIHGLCPICEAFSTREPLRAPIDPLSRADEKQQATKDWMLAGHVPQPPLLRVLQSVSKNGWVVLDRMPL